MPNACETILVPGPQLAGEALLQLADQAREQVDGDDARLGEIRREHVALHEGHAIGDARGARILARLVHQALVELDAKAARAELARRHDDDAAVARAEVGDEIVAACARELEHPLHHLLGCGDERHLPLDFLRSRAGKRQRQRQREQPHSTISSRIAARTSGRDQSIAP
jgi:hypothetical protein